MFNFINEKKLTITNDKIKQTERNAMRKEALTELMNVFANAGIEVGMTSEGIALNIPNIEEGAINFIVDLKVKDLTYDFYTEVDLYKEDQENKAKEAQAKAEAKARKIEADKARREAIAKAKEMTTEK